MKKIIAVVLSTTILLCSVFAVMPAMGLDYPYISEDGSTYTRLNNGAPVDFGTSYEEMIDNLQYILKNRQKPSTADGKSYVNIAMVDDYTIRISYNFASDFSEIPDYENYQYRYGTGMDGVEYTNEKNALSVARQFGLKIYDDAVFDENGYGVGKIDDYSYKSIYAMTNLATGVYLNDGDVFNSTQYYSYRFEFTVVYYTTTVQEEDIKNFAQVFSNHYINTDMSDYNKVKTIYDFVVRNTDYDYDALESKYQPYYDIDGTIIVPDKYKISHSAYGALFGSLIDYDDEGNMTADNSEEYDFSYKDSVVAASANQSEKILYKTNQGLAVCEGFSKLFCYLCNYNGIACRIVDGDYLEKSISKHDSDPHEWNYVYLDDGCGDGYKWFQVDTTFASQQSFKDVDFNSYDFFLCGSDNMHFSTANHQLPYGKADFTYAGPSTIKQLYKWYVSENISSVEDYQIGSVDFSSLISNTSYENTYEFMIVRETDYGEPIGVRYAFILYSWSGAELQVVDGKNVYSISSSDIKNAAKLIRDENGKIDYSSVAVNGFSYTGKTAKYSIFVPYVCSRSYDQNSVEVENSTAGIYDISIEGETSEFNAQFEIEPLDMSDPKSYDSIKVTDVKGNSINLKSSETIIRGYYTAKSITPSVSITDGFENVLDIDTNETTGDFDIAIYYTGDKKLNKSEGKRVDSILDRGYYAISIEYHGNYKGNFDFYFYVDKTLLSMITQKEIFEVKYFPEFYRDKYNIHTPADYFNANQTAEYKAQYTLSLLNIDGEKAETLYPLVDFIAIDKTGSIGYGDTGVVKVSPVSGSEKVIYSASSADNITQNDLSTTAEYIVSQKFDIASENLSFNGGYADSNTTNKYYYTGKEIKPTKFDNLDERLEKGKDYKITAYSNNINAGIASVTVQGINGCTGTVKMYYKINPANIGTAKVSASIKNSELNVVVTYNSKSLTEGVDYTKKVTTTKTDASVKYYIAVSGINNFSGGINYTYTVASPSSTKVKPSSSNNTVKLSKTSYTYDGNAKKPTVIFKNSSGKNVDPYYYSVSYSNNKKPGTATVTIKLKNGYSGSVSKTFKIKVAATSLSKLTPLSKAFAAKWSKKSSSNVTGYQIQYSTSSKFTNAKTVTISQYSTTSKKIKKLKSKKKYYVRIRCYKTISGKKYYSSWSSKKAVTTKK